MSHIYVLHFDANLSHAKHYIGCTDNLRGRLNAHATGAGARIMRELMARGIEWRLGSLMTCSHRHMRKLERSLKDQKNSSRYCAICSRIPAMFAGTQSYPVEALRFPTTSAEIRLAATPLTGQTVRLCETDEPFSTIQAILAMMKKDKDALGFIPAGGSQGLATLIPKRRIALAHANGDLIAYAAHTLDLASTKVTIHQCCTRDDARFRGAARSLVERIQNEYPDLPIIAKVRVDLAANHFWEALGFKVERTVIHPTSKNRINHYIRDLSKELALWLPTNTNNIEPSNSTKKENESSLPTSPLASSEKPAL